MVPKKKMYVCCAESDEGMVKDALVSIGKRLCMELSLYSLSDSDEKSSFGEQAIEEADFVLFFFTWEGARDPRLDKQFSLASHLNKLIIPVNLEAGKINLAKLKVKPPFVFRSAPLVYSEKEDYIKLVEQIHSALGLQKIGDVYGSFVNLMADRDVNIFRGEELMGHAVKDKPLRVCLSRGEHRITFSSTSPDEGDWVEYLIRIADDDSLGPENLMEVRACLADVEYVRYTDFKDLMFDPEEKSRLEWDTRADTIYFKLSRTSQDSRKREVVVESFYRKYIESLTPKPAPRYCDFKLIPDGCVFWPCFLLSIGIWGKLLLLLLSAFVYFISLGHFNWMEEAWKWMFGRIDMLLFGLAVVIWVFFNAIEYLYLLVLYKREKIRNEMEVNRVKNLNKKLYNRLNDSLASYLRSRGWVVENIRRIADDCPSSRLTVIYS